MLGLRANRAVAAAAAGTDSKMRCAAAKSALSTVRAAATVKMLERGAALELLIAGLDLITAKRAETVHAELLAAETAHDGTVDHGMAQIGERNVAVGGRNAAAGQAADE